MHPRLSVAQQCALLALPRSSFYYRPAVVSEADLELIDLLGEQYTGTPLYGSRRMQVALKARVGHAVNRKHVQRLMRAMDRCDGLLDEPKSGAPRRITDVDV